MGWQPIETAPLAERVLVILRHGEITFGYQVRVSVEPPKNWWTRDEDGSRCKPTHWMPLPEAPK